MFRLLFDELKMGQQNQNVIHGYVNYVINQEGKIPYLYTNNYENKDMAIKWL